MIVFPLVFFSLASRKPKTEGISHTKKSNPTISWDEVPELMKSIKENSCDGSILTQLALKFYLMSCCRVGALVRLEWDWFDESKDQWFIPPETSGLKRKRKNTNMFANNPISHIALHPYAGNLHRAICASFGASTMR